MRAIQCMLLIRIYYYSAHSLLPLLVCFIRFLRTKENSRQLPQIVDGLPLSEGFSRLWNGVEPLLWLSLFYIYYNISSHKKQEIFALILPSQVYFFNKFLYGLNIWNSKCKSCVFFSPKRRSMSHKMIYHFIKLFLLKRHILFPAFRFNHNIRPAFCLCHLFPLCRTNQRGIQANPVFRQV